MAIGSEYAPGLYGLSYSMYAKLLEFGPQVPGNTS